MIVQMTLDAPAQSGTVAKRGVVLQCFSVLGELPEILDLKFHLVCVGRLESEVVGVFLHHLDMKCFLAMLLEVVVAFFGCCLGLGR
jgi:hypothetical protein